MQEFYFRWSLWKWENLHCILEAKEEVAKIKGASHPYFLSILTPGQDLPTRRSRQGLQSTWLPCGYCKMFIISPRRLCLRLCCFMEYIFKIPFQNSNNTPERTCNYFFFCYDENVIVTNGIGIITWFLFTLFVSKFYWNTFFRIDTLKYVCLSQLAIIHLYLNRKHCLPLWWNHTILLSMNMPRSMS